MMADTGRLLLPMAGVLMGLTACGPVDPELARAEWMREVLVTADRVFLARSDGQVAAKYAAMAADPYAFLRGTVPWYYAALSRPDPDRPSTDFLTVPAATAVLLVGDPHPENCSTMATTTVADPARTQQSVEFIDLDAADWGPWLLDVRRGALGVHTLVAQLPGCAEDCRADVVGAFSDGYADSLLENRRGGLPSGRVLGHLLDEAQEEGPAQRRLEQVAPEVGGERRFVLEAGLLEELDPSEARLFDALLASMAEELPADLRVLDVARRYGRGISSMPALRFSVVVDRGSDSPEDDALMDIREVLDPVILPGRAVSAPGTFASNGERVVRAARSLWADPDADPLLAYGCLGRQCVKSLSKHAWFQDVERSKLQDDWAVGELDLTDLVELGAELGEVLARSHMRGGGVDGSDSALAIREDLLTGGGARVLRAELLRDTGVEHRRLLDDLALFEGLLDVHGPVLGAAEMVEHIP